MKYSRRSGLRRKLMGSTVRGFSLDPFPTIAQGGEGFFEALLLGLRAFGSGEPDDVFALAGGGEFLETGVGWRILLQRFGEVIGHGPGGAFGLGNWRDGRFGIEGDGGVDKGLEGVAVEALQGGDAEAPDVGVVLLRGEQPGGVGQFRAAKESHAEMLLARAEATDEFATAEAEHVPLDGFAEVRLPREDPFMDFFRERPGKIRARLQPLGGVFGAGAGAVHSSEDTLCESGDWGKSGD